MFVALTSLLQGKGGTEEGVEGLKRGTEKGGGTGWGNKVAKNQCFV